jgi:hypothetical protein
MKRLTGLLCLFFLLTVLCRNTFSAGTEKTWLADQSIGGSFGVQVKEWQTTPEDSMKSGPSAWAFCGTA